MCIRDSLIVGLFVQVEDFQKLHGALVHLFLYLVVPGQTKDAGQGRIFVMVVQAYFYIVQYRQIVKQTDVLERTGDTVLVDFDEMCIRDRL